MRKWYGKPKDGIKRHTKHWQTLKNCLSVSLGPFACPWLSHYQSCSDPSYQLLIVPLPSHVQKGWSWKRDVSKYQVSNQKAASEHQYDGRPQLQKQSLLWFRPRIYATDTHGGHCCRDKYWYIQTWTLQAPQPMMFTSWQSLRRGPEWFGLFGASGNTNYVALRIPPARGRGSSLTCSLLAWEIKAWGEVFLVSSHRMADPLHE